MANASLDKYEYEKARRQKLPALTAQEIHNNSDKLLKYFTQNQAFYYMLLCNENKDYTLFNLNRSTNYKRVLNDIFECLLNRGEVLDFGINELQAIEFWMRINNEISCYYFFPYDEGVIEYND